MQLHLDLTAVDSVEELDEQHGRVLDLGGELRFDRSADEQEPLRDDHHERQRDTSPASVG